MAATDPSVRRYHRLTRPLPFTSMATERATACVVAATGPLLGRVPASSSGRTINVNGSSIGSPSQSAIESVFNTTGPPDNFPSNSGKNAPGTYCSAIPIFHCGGYITNDRADTPVRICPGSTETLWLNESTHGKPFSESRR
jgi:hypothetical protein